MAMGPGRVFGVGLVACALSAGGCSGDDASEGSSGAGGAGGTSGAGGSGGAANCGAPPEPTGDETFDAVAMHFYEVSQAMNVPGGIVALYAKGKLHKLAFGSKKPTACDPVGPKTRFNIGRFSNALTAIAAIRMSQGTTPLLDLDEPIAQSKMPELIAHLEDDTSKQRGAPMNLRHILTSTSGYWPVYWGFGYCGPDVVPQKARVDGPESLELFFQPGLAPVLHEPGEMWMMSEPAMALAGRVMEKAADKSFPLLMKEYLADPAGLTLTFDQDEAFEGDLAGGFAKSCGALAPTWGGFATVDDLGALVASYAVGGGDGVFSKEEVAAQLHAGPSVTPAVKGGKAPMGLFGVPSSIGDIAFRQGHYTNNGGKVSTAFAVVPDKQFAVAYALNGDPEGYGLPERVQDWILKKYFPEYQSHDTSIPETTWAEYSGKYQAKDGMEAVVQAEAGQLKVSLTAGGQTEEHTFVPKSFVWWGLGTAQAQSIDEDWFGVKGVLNRPGFRFYRDANGQPTKLAPWVSRYDGFPVPGPFERVQ